MTDALIISNLLLWIAVMALLVAVIALSRQIGILYERVAPMGALMMDSGPAVGTNAPVLALTDLAGHAINIGAPSPRSTLVFFLSPTCPVCKKLLPIVQSAAVSERRWLTIVLASDGEEAEHRRFAQRAGLAAFPYVLSLTFLLLSLLAYVDARRWASLAFYALSLLTRSSALGRGRATGRVARRLRIPFR